MRSNKRDAWPEDKWRVSGPSGDPFERFMRSQEYCDDEGRRSGKAMDTWLDSAEDYSDRWMESFDQRLWDRYSALKRAGLVHGPDGLPENWEPSAVPDTLREWVED